MKPGKTAVLTVVALLVAALGSDLAEARPGGRHGGGGRHFGGHFHDGGHFRHGGRFHHRGGRVAIFAAPLFVPYFYYPRPYYPPVYYPPAPPVYIEQPQPAPQAWWYYCASAGAYYPHVQSCAEDWQRVAPQPAPR